RRRRVHPRPGAHGPGRPRRRAPRRRPRPLLTPARRRQPPPPPSPHRETARFWVRPHLAARPCARSVRTHGGRLVEVAGWGGGDPAGREGRWDGRARWEVGGRRPAEVLP